MECFTCHLLGGVKQVMHMAARASPMVGEAGVARTVHASLWGKGAADDARGGSRVTSGGVRHVMHVAARSSPSGRVGRVAHEAAHTSR
jgi:hypothetical protein